MALSLIQNTQVWPSGSSASTSLAFTSNVTAGSCLYAVSIWSGPSVTASVKTNETGTNWTALGSPQTGAGVLAGYRIQLFRQENAPAGTTTVVATYSSAVTTRGLDIIEVGGAPTSSPEIDFKYGTPNAAGVTTPTIDTTGFADAFLYAACGGAPGIDGVGGGYTSLAVPANWDGNGTEYKIVSSAGTYGPNFTESTARDNLVAFVAVKAATNAHAGFGVAGGVGAGVSASVSVESGAGIAGGSAAGFRPGTPVIAAPPATATAASSIADILSVAITAAACAATAAVSPPTVTTGLTPATVTAVAANASALTGTYAIDINVVAVPGGASASISPPNLAGIGIFPPAAAATATAPAPTVTGTTATPPATATFHLVVEAAFGAAPDALSPNWTIIANTNRNEFAPGNYSAAVLADSPKGYWKLDESSGTFADSSGNAHTATGHGGITYSQQGAVNTAVKLDGADQSYLSVADHADFDTGDVFTLEIWVKRNGPATHTNMLFDKSTDAYRLQIEASTEKISLRKADTGPVVFSTVPVPDDGNFHHLVCTKNGAVVHLYLDAIDVTGTITNKTITDTSHSLSIGGDDDGNQTFNGTIDEAAVYGTALTADRVLAHYQSRTGGLPPAYVRAMTWQRGRGTPLRNAETGTGGLLLRDADRRWEPKVYADIRPMLPVRAYAVTAAGKHLPIFSHNADGFPRRRHGRDYSEVAITTVDGMEGLALARVPPDRATFTTSFPGFKSDLTFTAWQPGPAGNDITITLTETKFNPGPAGTRVRVSVAGKAIIVNYLDHEQGAGHPSVEANEIKAAIEQFPAANALVEVTYPPGNDGEGTVGQNLPETHLVGGDTATFPEELGGARIERLLDLANWPVNRRQISVGQDLHGEIAFPTDEPAMLAHAQDVVSIASENGLLFVDGDGVMVFRDREARLVETGHTPEVVFSDRPNLTAGGGSYGSGAYGEGAYGAGGGVAEYKYVDFTPHEGKDSVINEATGSRADGIQQSAFDSNSAFLYRRRTQSFSSTLATDSQVQAALEAIVVEYAEPQERIERFTIMPGRDWNLWEKALELDVGSLIRIKEHPVNGDPVESTDYIIQGVSGDVPEDWYATRITFDVWPAVSIANWLILDDPVRGLLDAGNRVGR